MRIGKNWLDQLHYRHLKKQLNLQSRQQAPVGYKKATSIGILTDTQAPETLEVVKKFVQTHKDRQVKVLAYFNDKVSTTKLNTPTFHMPTLANEMSTSFPNQKASK